LPPEVLPPKLPLHIKEVMDFFRKISTQWVVGGMGGAIGLNYNAVVEVAKIYGFEITPYRMDLIRFIEEYILERSWDGSRWCNNQV